MKYNRQRTIVLSQEIPVFVVCQGPVGFHQRKNPVLTVTRRITMIKDFQKGSGKNIARLRMLSVGNVKRSNISQTLAEQGSGERKEKTRKQK